MSGFIRMPDNANCVSYVTNCHSMVWHWCNYKRIMIIIAILETYIIISNKIINTSRYQQFIEMRPKSFKANLNMDNKFYNYNSQYENSLHFWFTYLQLATYIQQINYKFGIKLSQHEELQYNGVLGQYKECNDCFNNNNKYNNLNAKSVDNIRQIIEQNEIQIRNYLILCTNLS